MKPGDDHGAVLSANPKLNGKRVSYPADSDAKGAVRSPWPNARHAGKHSDHIRKDECRKWDHLIQLTCYKV